ncbi:26S proteasome non-ATPase regulatory subunit, putative [Eimeria brunetti]|uniref:26S proteasome non-ATPase regulatory subunit, putative n=1 Tax=Eimeria brunetti TaxID=51314 RepID=U6LXG8_9EIME|nr:26S proteasome non-ATPase regulatory subunit, putative [Eimeria brunetti]
MEKADSKADPSQMDPNEVEALYPCCDIALWWHELQLPENDTTPERRAEAKAKLMQQIETNAMAPLYRKAIEEFGWPADEEKIKAMEQQQEKELEELERRLTEAQEKYGDTETHAVEVYKTAYKKSVGVGCRLDITLTLLRIGFVFKDTKLVQENLANAKE